jgi:hypothetical protein
VCLTLCLIVYRQLILACVSVVGIQEEFNLSVPPKDDAGAYTTPLWALGDKYKVFFARYSSVTFPHGTSKPRLEHSEAAKRYYSLKHAEWKLIAFSKIIHYCVEGLIGSAQEHSLFLTLDALKDSMSYEVEATLLAGLEARLRDAYAHLEATWPLALMTIILHIVMVHGAERVKRAGGTKLSHMFYMEDFFGVLVAGHPSVAVCELCVLVCTRVCSVHWAVLLVCTRV